MTDTVLTKDLQMDEPPAPVEATIPEYQKRQAEAEAALIRSKLGKPYTWEPVHPRLAELSRNRQKQIRKEAKLFRKHEIKRLKNANKSTIQ